MIGVGERSRSLWWGIVLFYRVNLNFDYPTNSLSLSMSTNSFLNMIKFNSDVKFELNEVRILTSFDKSY